jgi:hypothetical protein
MGNVLGLDVSSTCIGVCVVKRIDSNNVERLFMDHIDVGKCDTFWEKVDFTKNYFSKKIVDPLFAAVTCIGVEEALLGFRPGASSAATITTLVRFNALTSHVVRELFRLDPFYVPAPHARKVCGIKTMAVSKCNIAVKEQVFNNLIVSDLLDLEPNFPLVKTKDGSKKYKAFCYDMADAYVIAKATSRLYAK